MYSRWVPPPRLLLASFAHCAHQDHHHHGDSSGASPSPPPRPPHPHPFCILFLTRLKPLPGSGRADTGRRQARRHDARCGAGRLGPGVEVEQGSPGRGRQVPHHGTCDLLAHVALTHSLIHPLTHSLTHSHTTHSLTQHGNFPIMGVRAISLVSRPRSRVWSDTTIIG